MVTFSAVNVDADVRSSMDVGDLVAATLEGQDSRFVERCDRAAILSAIENHGIYDVDGLLAVLNDEASLPGLRAGIGAAAPPVFLTFMKRVAASRQSAPESPSHARTDERAGFSTPATSTRAGEMSVALIWQHLFPSSIVSQYTFSSKVGT